MLSAKNFFPIIRKPLLTVIKLLIMMFHTSFYNIYFLIFNAFISGLRANSLILHTVSVSISEKPTAYAFY